MDIFSYIRSWFVNPVEVIRNKRRAQYFDEYDNNIRSKIRRMSDTIEDDWLSSSSSSSLRKRNSSQTFNSLSKPPKLDAFPTITVDDDGPDDDVIEIKPKASVESKRVFKPARYTSTPDRRNHLVNGHAKFDNKNFLQANNLRKPFSRFVGSLMDQKPRLCAQKSVQTLHSAALDETFRLDEKMKYKEMLEKTAPNFTFRLNVDDSYLSPTGRICANVRSRRMIDSVKNRGDVITIEDKKTSPRCTTRDAIMKVLNDPIVIKDEDSDVEVLFSPPSPKPDIKVQRVNSLKTIIDTETSNREWLVDLTKRHHDKIKSNEEVIKQLQEHRKQLNEINNEIRIKTLEENIRKCLSFKEIILPVTVAEEELPELTEEHQRIVARVFSRNAPSSEVLARKFNLNITRHDLMTLCGLNWLNDEVINFYMNLIMERAKDSKFPKSYAMNTFFYPKLLKDGAQSLRRWTRKVDIFSYDLIAVPIHLGMHWCMSMIDLRAKTIKYYDSMGGANNRVLPALLDYLEKEHLDKKKEELNTRGWSMEIVRDIPQQMNGSDCGMFSCTFAEFLTRDAKITFSQEDMPYLRKKMVVEIVTGQLLIT